MLSWAILLLAILANTVLFREMPLVEGMIIFIHVLGFFVFVAVLWCVFSEQKWSPRILIASRVTAPRGTASSVFSEFESNGLPTTGLACLIGLNGPFPYLTGADSSVHLAEELKNSAWRLPRSMLITAITNYITSFVIIGRSFYILGYAALRP